MEDINATIGLVFRFAASIIAIVAIVYYFVKKGLSAPTAMKILRWILVFEAIYWLGLLATGVISVQGLLFRGFSNRPIDLVLSSSMSTATLLMESIAIPIALFKLASKLNPKKPTK